MPDNKKLQETIENLKKVKRIQLNFKLTAAGLTDEFKDPKKLDELLECSRNNPRILDMKGLLKAYRSPKNDPKNEKLVKAEAQTVKKLEQEFTDLKPIVNGLLIGTLDLALVNKTIQRLEKWVKGYKQLVVTENQDKLKENYGLSLEFHAKLKETIKAIQAFDNANKGDKFSIKNIKPEELIKGLSYFNDKLDKNKGKEYLQKLQQEKKEVESFSEAAEMLFGDDKKVVKKVKDFKISQVIVVDYPSEQIGIYYRGDKRSPENIKKTGFLAFDQLTIKDARERVIKWFGAKDPQSPGAYHEEHIRKNLSAYISFGNDIGCMGYGCNGPSGASRNVYQVSVKGLKVVQPSLKSLGEEPHAKQGPILLMDKDTVAEATIIAVKGVVAAETTFFTGIKKGIRLIYQGADPNNEIKGGWVEKPVYF